MGEEHIVSVSRGDVAALRAWLGRPNGALKLGRVTFEAVEGGSIWVRTAGWKLEGNES